MAYKLVCFDLDGTLIDETIFIWQTIHDALKTDKQKRDNATERFYKKEISYEEWAEIDITLWKNAGGNKQKLMNAIKPLKLMKGAKETLLKLKKHGFKLAVISGSLDIALEYVLPEYKQIFNDIYINKLLFTDEGNIGRIITTKHDFEHKATALKEIAKKEGFELKECVFVGDHKNDIHAAEIAGLSIAFNSKSEELNKICHHVIEKKDLREILRMVLIK